MVSPAFTFDDIDVVITRHSLRNMFDFIGNNNREGFRLNLQLVGIKTLIVEPAEEEHTLDRGPGDLSTACERGFTKKLLHLEETEGYYRIVRYRIGELQCAVQCEVDACYEEPSPIGTGENLGEELGEEGTLSKESQQSDSATTRSFGVDATNHDTAEIKTSVSANKGAKIRVVKKALPQLWFGRIAWLIFGRIKGSTVSWHKPRLVTQGAEAINLDDWAFQERLNLAKLALVLSELRDQVQNDKRCVAVCPAYSTRLTVYPQQMARGALPEDLLRRFWPPQASVSGHETRKD
ncbi:Geranylgeranyl pyrophosphate synthetase [Colletotrichum asianum]